MSLAKVKNIVLSMTKVTRDKEHMILPDRKIYEI